MIFDAIRGIVAIGSKRFVGNMLFSDVVAAGLVFEDEIDMRTGWIYRCAEREIFGEHVVAPALGFQGERLRSLTVEFLEDSSLSVNVLFERHREFLFEQLGNPSKMTIINVSYRYEWGEIAAGIDMHNSSSYISVAWR